MRSACVLRPDTNPDAATRGQYGVADRSKPPSRSTCAPEVAHDGGVAVDEVVDVALEVRRLRDVHRRATTWRASRRSRAPGSGRCGRIRRARRSRWSRAPAAGSADPSASRRDRRRMLPKLPEGTAKSTGSPSPRGDGEVALEVVDDLRGDARPVDRVDGADPPARLERRVGAHRLDDVLAVVEHAVDRDVVDVGVRQREHLRLLERAHPPERDQHEHGEAALAPHRVLGRAAGVAGRRAEDVEALAARGQHVLEQVAEELQRDVLERERRSVRHVQQVQARLERASPA